MTTPSSSNDTKSQPQLPKKQQQEQEEDDWVLVLDKNDESSSSSSHHRDNEDPLTIALLYKDMSADSCGHAVKWKSERLIQLKNCPVCQEPVQVICDGGQAHPPLQKINSSINLPPSPLPFVMVKYGKQTFVLSVPPLQTLHEPTQSNDHPPSSTWWIFWSRPCNKNMEGVILTAQDRLQQAMGLASGMKILHKGKVLFPPSLTTTTATATTTTTTTTTTLEDTNADTTISLQEQISNQLVQISETDWNLHKKASLVVMGTRIGHELQEPPQNNGKINHQKRSKQQLFTFVLTLPVQILRWSLHCSLLFLETFLSPFLPNSLLLSLRGIRRGHNDYDDDDDDDDHHHHQD